MKDLQERAATALDLTLWHHERDERTATTREDLAAWLDGELTLATNAILARIRRLEAFYA